MLASLNLFILVVLLLLAYFLYKYVFDYDYWKRKGVHSLKPLPFIGNLYEVFTLRSSLIHLLARFYSEVDLPYFGIYFLNKPFLIAKSPNFIQTVLIKDFSYFCDRGLINDEEYNLIISKTFAALKNPAWNILRSKMSPIFSIGKIRNMCYLMNETAQEQNIYIKKHIKNAIEVKELSSKYMTDVTTSCMFGIHAYAFQNEESEFREAARKIFEFSFKTSFAQSCCFVAHSLVRIFKLRFLDPDVCSFLSNAFLRTFQQREISKHIRHDLIDICIEMRNREGIDIDTCIAQAIQFFLAGFDTTSSAIAFTLYELALNTEIQNRLREDVEMVVSKHGAFTFDSINSMRYLDLVLSETLRKYPSLGFIDRVCVKDYKVPESELVIDKGTIITIPLMGLHHDKNYFPEPEKYDPERFLDESLVKKFFYMPFGDGPRSCIGKRFAVLVAKLSLAHIVSKFEVEPCDTTPIPIKYETKSFFLAATGGLPLKFNKIPSKVV